MYRHSGSTCGESSDLSRSGARIYWYSVVSGWAATFGVGLILSAPVIGVLLMAGELEVPQATRVLGWTGTSGVAFLAFLYGGYVSGSLSRYSGLKHGLLVPLLNLLAALSLTLLVLVSRACIAFAHSLFDTFLPGAGGGVGQEALLPTITSPYLLIPLSLSLLGGALGGTWGGRSDRRSMRGRRSRSHASVYAIRVK